MSRLLLIPNPSVASLRQYKNSAIQASTGGYSPVYSRAVWIERELNRVKVVQAVIERRLKHYQAAKRLGVAARI
ncbi:hypothetical protein [Mycoavidus sp. SF9855]|uniref:hypothetical protein n=1 Tax=Mycoavidus sp. SF9855 TaxID=2968475 RepID=UPI00211BDE18|nr:hypothetical protein [Mycoavidus sp. SF9855]UUM20736.1 hypothetical protein NQD60_04420 [Mycoavidus sp. SF9855]